MSYIIRPMTVEDIPAVMAVDAASFATPWPEKAYRFDLEGKTLSITLVAVHGEEIVGMIVGWVVLDEMHIATIGVHPAHRRQGVGRKLLATALLLGIQEGVGMATLEVRLSNLPAQNLYRAFGFQVVGRRPRYYKNNNEDALLMTVFRLDAEKLQALAADQCERQNAE